MRSYHILVAGPELASRSLVDALAERGLSAWSDRVDQVLDDQASLEWADIVVLFDRPEGVAGDRSRFDAIPAPKLLLTTESLSTEDRAALIDRSGFEFVLPWPAPPALIAAFVERTAHRCALSVRATVRV